MRTIDYQVDIRRPSPEAAHLLLQITTRAVANIQEATPWLRKLVVLMVGTGPETYPGFEFAYWLIRRFNPWCVDIHDEIENACRQDDLPKARADLLIWLDNVNALLQDVLEPQDAAWLNGMRDGLRNPPAQTSDG